MEAGGGRRCAFEEFNWRADRFAACLQRRVAEVAAVREGPRENGVRFLLPLWRKNLDPAKKEQGVRQWCTMDLAVHTRVRDLRFIGAIP